MNKIIFLAVFITSISSCIPENIEQEMSEGMHRGFQMMDDQHFKTALSYIELYKLRNGDYPNELTDLQYISIMDSSVFQRVEYTKLDSLYELNLKPLFPQTKGNKKKKKKTKRNGAGLKYPPEFWNGLGCAKSNMK